MFDHSGTARPPLATVVRTIPNGQSKGFERLENPRLFRQGATENGICGGLMHIETRTVPLAYGNRPYS